METVMEEKRMEKSPIIGNGNVAYRQLHAYISE